MVLSQEIGMILDGYGFPLLIQKKNRFGYLRIKDILGFSYKTRFELLCDRQVSLI
jgi:hypothetical protein